MQIIIGNSIIPTPAGIKLQSVFRSPLFSTPENKIPGSYIFNTPFPATEILRKVFGQAHRVQRHGRATAELPYVITDGSLRFAGNCIVTEASKDNYEIAFKIDNGDFAGRLGNKTLKDLDLGGDRTLSSFNISRPGINADQGFSAAQNNGSFEEEYPFSFDEMLIDTSSSFNLIACTFTAPQSGEYIFTVSMDLRVFFGSPEIYLYLNTAYYKAVQIGDGHNTYNVKIELTAGDVIYFSIHAFSAEDGFQETIDFSILSGSFISLQYNDIDMTGIVAGNQDTYDFAFFPVHNKEFLSNFPDDAFQLDNLNIKTLYTEYFPVLNYFANGRFPLYLTGLLEGQFFSAANFFTPFVYMKYILGKITEGYTIVNNPFDNGFENMVLFNAYAENNYALSDTTLLPFNETFNLVNHVPEVKQSDFLNWITMLTGFFPVVDNNTNTITFIDIKDKNVLKPGNTAIAWPGILLPNPVVKVDPEFNGIKLELKKAGADKYLERIKELNPKINFKGTIASGFDLPMYGNSVNDMYFISLINMYYIFQYDPESYTLKWCFYSFKFPLIYTEGEEPYLTINTELCPILTAGMPDSTLGAPANRSWTLPITEQAGILEGFPDSLGAEYGLQVLYYKGMVNDSLGGPYPLGSSRMANYASNPDSSPDLSAEGIYNDRYKGFLQWLAYHAKPATYKTILTRSQLKSIKYGQVYAGDGFNFLIKELRVNLQADGLSIAEVDIYTC